MLKKIFKAKALPEAPANFKSNKTALKPIRDNGLETRTPFNFNKTALKPIRNNWLETRTPFDTELPLDAEPFGMRPEPPAFALVLDKVLQKLKLNVSPVAERLKADWKKLLPPEIAGRCLPGKIQRQIFYVYAPDSTVLFELQREFSKIESALLPALADARVKHVRLMIEPEAFAVKR